MRTSENQYSQKLKRQLFLYRKSGRKIALRNRFCIQTCWMIEMSRSSGKSAVIYHFWHSICVHPSFLDRAVEGFPVVWDFTQYLRNIDWYVVICLVLVYRMVRIYILFSLMLVHWRKTYTRLILSTINMIQEHINVSIRIKNYRPQVSPSIHTLDICSVCAPIACLSIRVGQNHQFRGSSERNHFSHTEKYWCRGFSDLCRDVTVTSWNVWFLGICIVYPIYMQ